jgi:hypothetical protein
VLRHQDVLNTELVLTAWRYGRQYGAELGVLQIMGCINNRTRLGWGSMLEVLERIPKFSATIEQPPFTYPNIWDQSFIKLLHAVEGVVSGSAPDLSKGCLYWCDSLKIDNPWFKEQILGNREVHPRLVEMGTLWLFK